jgi:hypothetical protein
MCGTCCFDSVRPPSDGLADVGKLRDFVRDLRNAVGGRLSLSCRWSRRGSGSCGRWRRCSSGRRLAGGAVDVGLDDSAAGAGAAEGGKVDALLLGEAPSERARLDAVARVGLGLHWCGLRLCFGDLRILGGIGAIAFHVGRRRGRRGLSRASLPAALGDRLRRCGGSGGGGDILAFAGDEGDDGSHLHFVRALGDEDLGDRPFIDGFEFHRRLVGFNFCQEIARSDAIALLDQPFGERALLHRWR